MIRLVLLGLVLVVVWWIWQRLQTPQPGEPPQLEGKAEPPPAGEDAPAAAAAEAEEQAEAEIDEIECPVCRQLVTVDDHGNPTGGCSRPDCPWPLAATEGAEPRQDGPGQDEPGPAGPGPAGPGQGGAPRG